MCGIAGFASRNVISEAELDAVSRVNQSLVHRGPDGEGQYGSAHVALAMRRLSIIDLEGGWQPLYNEDRSLTLIANGEIYNFVELRQQLESHGHQFSTGSDCETILHLYEEHGTDCVLYLRGMFSFALWDAKRQRLMLARDRMGEKPLYIYESDGQLLFASEMKALLASGMVPFELDAPAIDLYFHYQYVPEPLTPLKGVRKLDAGHILEVDVADWRVSNKRYWSMEDAPPLAGDPATLIREELETVSEIVIRSDVPVGVALSGGLDSSAIAALAARKYAGRIEAFSVGYPGRPESDERNLARSLADDLNMPFHEVELDVAAMVEFFPELVYWRDDPIADISGYGYYKVSKIAREHNVPVMLQGQGGDELFWGYPWVQQAAIESARKAETQGAGVSALPGYLAPQLPQDLSAPGLSRWARSLAGLRPGWQNFQSHRRTPADQFVFYDLSPDFREAATSARDHYASGFLEQLNGSGATQLFTFAQPWPDINVAITRLICDLYLRENGIAQGDRLSMASSIELRLPLVDHRLVETVIGLRKTHSDVRETPKAWFKAALRGVLSDEVMDRPKRGFAPPTRDWHNAIFARHGNLLVDGQLVQEKVLSATSARQLATGPFPSYSTTPFSFKALVLEHWCRQMLRAIEEPFVES